MGKIFGIGLSGTGTKSLVKALTILGYKTKHYPWSLEEIEEYEASADIPVSCRYRELDVLFPGSRFILTNREKESWLDSRSRKPPDQWKQPLWVLETRLRTYGRLSYEHDHYVELYDEYHEGVAEYFRDRPDDLLHMNIVAGETWEPLCRFLGIDRIPDEPFPWIKKKKKKE